MCAINGFNYKDLSLIKKMSALTSSRGLDNEGFYLNEVYHVAQQVLSKNYYDFSHHINLDECKKLIMRHKEEYCDPFLIWNLISLQIFFKKLQTLK
jgi:hypothetical protein